MIVKYQMIRLNFLKNTTFQTIRTYFQYQAAILKETTKMGVSIDNGLSEVPFFWGWFTSKSNWDEINFDKDRIILDLRNATLWFRNAYRIYFSYLFRLTKNSSIDTWDTDIVWHCVSKRLFCIYPRKIWFQMLVSVLRRLIYLVITI